MIVSRGFCFLVLALTIVVGLTVLCHRYDQVHEYRSVLFRLSYDIAVLEKKQAQMEKWAQSLVTDPAAWEQVAREKMNYLEPDEVLITFVPAVESP